MDILLTLAGLLMALVAGVFLAFSDFVMRGLAQAGAPGAAGMVGLNRTVYRSAFMGMLVGLAPGSLALAGLAAWQLDGLARGAAIGGAAAYLLGVMAVTGLGNVPLNTRLDAAMGQGRAAGLWPAYVRDWTRLNHLRTVAATLAASAWLLAGVLA
ncbi:anthrone oxygenase family protein [Roseicyclus sp.]|uniref:anthrone oxygenase family protein n=1 Tax=Roseicyclus sp. TaxID=1914329 RepID=UPI003F9ECE1C